MIIVYQTFTPYLDFGIWHFHCEVYNNMVKFYAKYLLTYISVEEMPLIMPINNPGIKFFPLRDFAKLYTRGDFMP